MKLAGLLSPGFPLVAAILASPVWAQNAPAVTATQTTRSTEATRLQAAVMTINMINDFSERAASGDQSTAQNATTDADGVGNRHLLIGGDVAATIAPEDPGFFTYGSYDHSTLREFRVALAAELRANARLSVLGEVRSQNFEDVTAFALYARIRPFAHRRFDVQVGRIPPTFGRASRLFYARANPL